MIYHVNENHQWEKDPNSTQELWDLWNHLFQGDAEKEYGELALYLEQRKACKSLQRVQTKLINRIRSDLRHGIHLKVQSYPKERFMHKEENELVNEFFEFLGNHHVELGIELENKEIVPMLLSAEEEKHIHQRRMER